MTEKLLVPDIGDFENVEVIELLVKEGQEIKKNDPVVTIESDKSSVEIPSTFSGKIESIKVKVGDKVSKGDLILDVSNFDQSSFASKVIPKDTENLIQEAEKALGKSARSRIKEAKEIDKRDWKKGCRKRYAWIKARPKSVIGAVKTDETRPKGSSTKPVTMKTK